MYVLLLFLLVFSPQILLFSFLFLFLNLVLALVILVHHLKAAVRNFFLVKNDPKSIFEQEHNQPVFKTITLL